MYDKSRVNLRNPWLAAFLGFLIPGAGHFYQRRMFKAGVFSVCILSTFFGGMALGEWQTCHFQTYSGQGRQTPGRGAWGFVAQVMVGLPSLSAVVQSRRYREFILTDPNPDLSAFRDTEFEGIYFEGDTLEDGIPIKGDLRLMATYEDDGIHMRENSEFVGVRTDTGERIGLTVDRLEPLSLSPDIGANPRRGLECVVVDDTRTKFGRIAGDVPRKFWNWFQMPLRDDDLERLHGTLGKQFDLALVFTWIAGLLNLLAVWDALEGPAYGMGDEPDPEPEA